MTSLAEYTERFSRLRSNAGPARWPDTLHHRAPHKPLLLLAVLDQFADGALTGNLIEPSDDLAELFALYWSRIMPPEHRGVMALPFFHLRSDGFWHLVPRPGKEVALGSIRQIQSLSQLHELLLGARLDDDLFLLLHSGHDRDALRATLIEANFSRELWATLFEQGKINFEAFEYSQQLLNHPAAERRVAKEYLAAARDQGFRRAIVTAYSHRCALCGVRVLSSDGHSAVEAGHIVPWSLAHNDDPGNGMALCRLCHWTFDEGLIGVTPKYLVMPSPQLTARGNMPGHLMVLAGRDIIGPDDRRLWPEPAALGWHQRKVFRRR